MPKKGERKYVGIALSHWLSVNLPHQHQHQKAGQAGGTNDNKQLIILEQGRVQGKQLATPHTRMHGLITLASSGSQSRGLGKCKHQRYLRCEEKCSASVNRSWNKRMLLPRRQRASDSESSKSQGQKGNDRRQRGMGNRISFSSGSHVSCQMDTLG